MLLEAACRVFARKGYMRAEINDITIEAGKSAGVFYNYFENKDVLLRTLVEDLLRELQAKILQPLNPPEQIADVLRNLWDAYKTHGAIFRALTEAATFDPAFAQLASRIRNFARTDYRAMVKVRQDLGFMQHIEADHAAEVMDRMITYSLYEWFALPDSDSLDPSEEERAFATMLSMLRAILELDP